MELLLGHGDEEDQLLPKKIEALAGQRVVSVSAGEQHSLAITADGAVWSWGHAAQAKPRLLSAPLGSSRLNLG